MIKLAALAGRHARRALAAGAAVVLLTSCGSGDPPKMAAGGPLGSYVVPAGIHKIKHVIIVMQENRSFDSYFGTFPGADGIPAMNGVPTVCVPNPQGGCTRLYHDTADINGGGPHGVTDAVADVDSGKMDGFIAQRDAAKNTCRIFGDPACSTQGAPDVMGYHTAAEIPNYWAYAKNYALDDHMFEPVKSWSLPDHMFLVSAWSARCKSRYPMSCTSDIVGPYGVNQFSKAVRREIAKGQTMIDLAWTDITWLLHAHQVSWAYYVQTGTQPDCADDAAETCAVVRQNASTPGIWNPLPLSATCTPTTNSATSSRWATTSARPQRGICPR